MPNNVIYMTQKLVRPTLTTGAHAYLIMWRKQTRAHASATMHGNATSHDTSKPAHRASAFCKEKLQNA